MKGFKKETCMRTMHHCQYQCYLEFYSNFKLFHSQLTVFNLIMKYLVTTQPNFILWTVTSAFKCKHPAMDARFHIWQDSLLWAHASTGFSVEIFKRSPRDPFVFELGVPNKISVIESLFYTVMSCQSCAFQGRIAFHFLLPKLIYCVKYAIFCINENPAV